MSQYDWAQNKLKLQRAIANASKKQGWNEDDVKNLYVTYGGALNVIPEPTPEPKVEVVKEKVETKKKR